MKKLFLFFALFISAVPVSEAGPLGLRPLSGLGQANGGGPRARIARIQARRDARQARRDARQARRDARAAAKLAAPAAAVAAPAAQ